MNKSDLNKNFLEYCFQLKENGHTIQDIINFLCDGEALSIVHNENFSEYSDEELTGSVEDAHSYFENLLVK